MEEKKKDLCERLFEFAVKVIEFLKTLPYSPENKTIRTQLSKSACSSGANYEESQSGSSKADFTNNCPKITLTIFFLKLLSFYFCLLSSSVTFVL